MPRKASSAKKRSSGVGRGKSKSKAASAARRANIRKALAARGVSKKRTPMRRAKSLKSYKKYLAKKSKPYSKGHTLRKGQAGPTMSARQVRSRVKSAKSAIKKAGHAYSSRIKARYASARRRASARGGV